MHTNTPTTDDDAPAAAHLPEKAHSAVLEIRSEQSNWTPAQKAVLSTMGLEKASPNELGALLHASQRYGLDPFAKQISMIPRWDSKARAERYSIMILLDGYFALAERTGRYLGIDGPYWCGQDGQWTDVWLADGPPAAAKVTVRFIDHAGREASQTAVVTYKSRVQTNKEGQPMALWKSMPEEMLANGAIRKALRMALPEALDTVEDLAEDNVALAQMGRDERVPIGGTLRAPRALHAASTFDPEDPMGLDAEPPAESRDAVATFDESDVPDDDDGAGEIMASVAQRRVVKMLSNGLDDKVYREVLWKVGVESSTQLTADDAEYVIAELNVIRDNLGLNDEDRDQ